MTKPQNITEHHYQIGKSDRMKLKGHSPKCIWMTGLSGAGKSTIAALLERLLFDRGFHTYVLDGDNLRNGLNSDLSFSQADRSENIRRVANVAKLMVDAGDVVICALISPLKSDRDYAKSLFGSDEFFEVFIDTPIAVCKRRDPKGLYAKVSRGEIFNFTGIDSPYESPQKPDMWVKTADISAAEAAGLILEHLLSFSNK